jgi:hypothetical protein
LLAEAGVLNGGGLGDCARTLIAIPKIKMLARMLVPNVRLDRPQVLVIDRCIRAKCTRSTSIKCPRKS